MLILNVIHISAPFCWLLQVHLEISVHVVDLTSRFNININGIINRIQKKTFKNGLNARLPFKFNSFVVCF